MELEASNREFEAFAYSVSHDLRAPLRIIDGFSKILEDDYAGRVDDEGRDALRRVRAAAQGMAEQIDDLLKLSRVSRAELAQEQWI
jgi:light-regulated signal transduction histidine kinase (bacteriophytochrome)